MNANKPDIEIMSPVGSFESLQAAFQGGAGSVYFGVGRLNMRARSSKNFTMDDLREITGACRDHGVKSYITLNTVIFDSEMEEMKRVVNAALENNVSAVIASDPSVIRYAHEAGMEVHMSTQANITNTEAVRYWSQYADVMVLARELTLDQVTDINRQIREQDITGPSGALVRTEIFIHGALCMAISGKCYLSLDNFNHSANRGECFQLCRRGYLVTDIDGDFGLEIDNRYIMSPKDLKTLDFLDRIIGSGVTVLKIEGRGRSPEYVKTVTKVYREAVDAVLSEDFDRTKIDLWNKELKRVYNRGFWDGYYLGRKLGEWSDRYGSQASEEKTYVGTVTNFYNRIGVAEITLRTGTLSKGDRIMIIGKTTGVYEGTAVELRKDETETDAVRKGDVFSMPVSETVRRGDKVYLVNERRM